MRCYAAGGKGLLLVRPGITILSMGDDGHARRPLRHAGCIEELQFQFRDARRAGRHFDGAGPDARIADALGDFADIKLRDFVHGARAPVSGQAHRLEIKAGGADDLHCGSFRDLPHLGRVAAEFDRTGIDEGFDPVFLAQLAQALDRLGDEGGTLEADGGVEFGAPERQEQVLVHQGAPELIEADWTGDRLNLH